MLMLLFSPSGMRIGRVDACTLGHAVMQFHDGLCDAVFCACDPGGSLICEAHAVFHSPSAGLSVVGLGYARLKPPASGAALGVPMLQEIDLPQICSEGRCVKSGGSGTWTCSPSGGAMGTAMGCSTLSPCGGPRGANSARDHVCSPSFGFWQPPDGAGANRAAVCADDKLTGVLDHAHERPVLKSGVQLAPSSVFQGHE